jgi:hypothetical protein
VKYIAAAFCALDGLVFMKFDAVHGIFYMKKKNL